MSETNNAEWTEHEEMPDEEVQQSQRKDTTDNLRRTLKQLKEENPDVIESMRQVALGQLSEEKRGKYNLEAASLEEIIESHLEEQFASMEPNFMNSDELVSNVIESTFAGIVREMSEQDQMLIDSKRANIKTNEPNEENHEALEEKEDAKKARREEKIKTIKEEAEDKLSKASLSHKVALRWASEAHQVLDEHGSIKDERKVDLTNALLAAGYKGLDFHFDENEELRINNPPDFSDVSDEVMLKLDEAEGGYDKALLDFRTAEKKANEMDRLEEKWYGEMRKKNAEITQERDRKIQGLEL